MLSDALFIGVEVQKRSVDFPDGSRHELHFKEAPASAFRNFFSAGGGDGDVQAMGRARLIAASLVNEDGSPALDAEKALTLKDVVATALINVILELNGYVPSKKEGDAGNA